MRELGPCVPLHHEICGNALDDNCNGLLEDGCGSPGGLVQFMASWAWSGADVDLHVFDPTGALIEEERPSQSGLYKPRDCPGRNDECEGTNLENVYLEGSRDALRGHYRVEIRLESLGGAEPPVWVTLSTRLKQVGRAFEIALDKEEEAVSFDFRLE